MSQFTSLYIHRPRNPLVLPRLHLLSLVNSEDFLALWVGFVIVDDFIF